MLLGRRQEEKNVIVWIIYEYHETSLSLRENGAPKRIAGQAVQDDLLWDLSVTEIHLHQCLRLVTQAKQSRDFLYAVLGRRKSTSDHSFARFLKRSVAW